MMLKGALMGLLSFYIVLTGLFDRATVWPPLRAC